MKSYLLIISLVLVLFSSCKEEDTSFPIIPYPNNIDFGNEHFTLSKEASVYTNLSNLEKVKIWLTDLDLHEVIGIQSLNQKNAGIYLFLDKNIEGTDDNESYHMSISKSDITIRSKSEAGLFYGIQSLIQLKNKYRTKIPALVINDAPRFAIRSLMLDVSSFYILPAFIKKQMDIMALYKFNRLQLHLGGEGGWRINIEEYPLLVENTAWRSIKNFQEMKLLGGEFCTKDTKDAFGGYYTTNEIQDLVAYASLKNITIIPSIDLPDVHFDIAHHASLSINEEEQKHFIKSALASLIKDFPSEYIYIGNGKADDSFGTACESCRDKVDETDLLDGSEAYYSILQEASSFLKAYGKKLITWEESLRMDLPEDPTIIAWHDKVDAINAAKRKQRVIIAPANVASLNVYQSNPTQSPKAMSGFLPLEKAYEFNLSAPDSVLKYIDGVQINMWTQNVDKESDIEYQLYPRLLAFAEVGWTQVHKKSYLNFKQRIQNANNVLAKNSYNYFDIANEAIRRKEQTEPVNSLAKYKTVEYQQVFSSEFPAKGLGSLTDGIRGGWHYSDGNWQGFAGEKISVTINLEKETDIKMVSADFIKDKGGYVYLPKEINLYTSNDGVNFELLSTIKDGPYLNDNQEYQIVNYKWEGKANTHFLKFEALKTEINRSWLFTDEIIIQ